MHHARWMSKALYVLKIYIFKKQFQLLRKKQISGLAEISIFIVKFYVKAWFTAPNPITCPNNDLKFFQDLIAYKNKNEKVAEAALDKITNHLWYLTDEAVSLAFFDPNVSVDCKTQMVHALKNKIKKKLLSVTSLTTNLKVN